MIRPHSLRAWILAARPATLSAALAPLLAGTAIAYHAGKLRVDAGILAALCALLLQIISNFANDVFDFEKGSDTEERLGPTRAVAAGLISPRAMKRGLALLIVLALACGSALAYLVGWQLLALGVLCILAAVAYTGGPYPLGYHGLGDVFVFVFFGYVAVGGVAYVHLHEVPQLAYFAGTALGALSTNILVVNNLRDRTTDAHSGKRTLAVRFGRRGAELEYLLMVGLSAAMPLAAYLMGEAGAGILLPLLALPLSWARFVAVKQKDGRELNAELKRSAQLVFLSGLLWTLGLLL